MKCKWCTVVAGVNRVALLRGGAWIEIAFVAPVVFPDFLSHSFAGVRGLKFSQGKEGLHRPVVALLRGGAWIEIQSPLIIFDDKVVALLRGGAWIEIIKLANGRVDYTVALLRGGAWIEISISIIS